MTWNPLVEAEVPEGCLPCRLCGTMCQEAEGVIDGFDGRGKLIRIWNGCAIGNDQYEKDDIRTEFGTVEEAVAQWNHMNSSQDPD